MLPLACNEEEHPQAPPHCIPCAGLTTALYPAPHSIPATQLVHVDVPTTELHVAAAQALQVLAPDALYVLAVQCIQTLSTVAPTAALYVPAMQFVQTLSTFAPTAALHVPAVQFVQAAEP
jgi:hypothetical protein